MGEVGCWKRDNEGPMAPWSLYGLGTHTRPLRDTGAGRPVLVISRAYHLQHLKRNDGLHDDAKLRRETQPKAGEGVHSLYGRRRLEDESHRPLLTACVWVKVQTWSLRLTGCGVSIRTIRHLVLVKDTRRDVLYISNGETTACAHD